MSARQTKKRGKGRNSANNRERTVTTLTEDPNTPYLVPTPSEEPASSPTLSPQFLATTPSGNPNSLPAQSTYHSPGNYRGFGYSNFSNGSMQGHTHPSSLAGQQHQYYSTAQQDQANVILPPGKNDLEILENLKEIIKNGQHPMYRPVPQPAHLASVYLGTTGTQKPGFQGQDAGYAEHSELRESHEEAASNTGSNGVAEGRGPAPTSPTELSRRPPRVQPKDSWDRSKSISEPIHDSQPSSSHHNQPQAPREINTSSAPSVSGPPSASVMSADGQTSDSPMQPVGDEAEPTAENDDQPDSPVSGQPQNDTSVVEDDSPKDAFEARNTQAEQVKSEAPPADERRRDVIYSRPPGPPISGYNDRGFHPRDDRYHDHRDYRDRRVTYDRYRDNRYPDTRRGPPENRHYESSYDRPPAKRYNDAAPAYHSRRPSDSRSASGHFGDAHPVEAAGSAAQPHTYNRPAGGDGPRQSYPPASQTAHVRSHTQETKPVDRTTLENTSSKPPTTVASIQAPIPDRAHTPPLQQKPSDVSQPSSTTLTPTQPPKEEPKAVNQGPAQERTNVAPVHQSPQQTFGNVDPARSNPPSRQTTVDDRHGPPPASARYARAVSPTAGERATYPPASATPARPGPPPHRDDRGYRAPPSSSPTRPPGREFRPRDLSRERPQDYRPTGGGAPYRPPADRNYDSRRPDAMDIDSQPPPARYNADRAERPRPPPASAGPGIPSNPPYDSRYPGGRDYYAQQPYSERDEYRRPPESWDRPGGRPPPASAPAGGERDRFDQRENRDLPPPPNRPYVWDTRDDRDRRDGFPARPGSPRSYPGGGGGQGRPAASRSYESGPPQPPPAGAYNRRQRSLSPARRPTMDDARPTLKRPRDDEYGDYYTGAPPSARRANDYPPRAMSPPPTSAGSYYDRAPPPPSSASTSGSGAPPSERPYTQYPYDRPRSPPSGRPPYSRPAQGYVDRRYAPAAPPSSMPPARRA